MSKVELSLSFDIPSSSIIKIIRIGKAFILHFRTFQATDCIIDTTWCFEINLKEISDSVNTNKRSTGRKL